MAQRTRGPRRPASPPHEAVHVLGPEGTPGSGGLGEAKAWTTACSALKLSPLPLTQLLVKLGECKRHSPQGPGSAGSAGGGSSWVRREVWLETRRGMG